jgi:membrane protein implicated in regulation of membrane protease activity
MLTVILTAIVGLFCLGFLILLSGGYFLWLVLILMGSIAYFGLHYLLWGKMMTDAVAGEREEEELRRRAEAREFGD